MAAHPFGLGLGEVGPRAVMHAANAVKTESSLLLVGLEIGWLGLALYLALLVALVIRFWRRLAGHRRRAIALSVLAALLPAQLLLPTLQEVSVSWLGWVVLGLLLPARPVPVGGADDATARPGRERADEGTALS